MNGSNKRPPLQKLQSYAKNPLIAWSVTFSIITEPTSKKETIKECLEELGNHSVIHGLGFFICFTIYWLTHFFHKNLVLSNKLIKAF